METDRLKLHEDSVDFTYEGPQPKVDLLDYRYMEIEMRRRADTGKPWLSVLALFVITFACLVAVVLWQISLTLMRG